MSKYAGILLKHGCTVPGGDRSVNAHLGPEEDSPCSIQRLASLDLDFSSTLVQAESGKYKSPDSRAASPGQKLSGLAEVQRTGLVDTSPYLEDDSYSSGDDWEPQEDISMGKGGFTTVEEARRIKMSHSPVESPHTSGLRSLNLNRRTMKERLLRNKNKQNQ